MLERARHGEHVCCLLSSRAEQEELALEYLRAGLASEDRVWYIAADDPERVLALARSQRPELERPLRERQLLVSAAGESYLSVLPFDPARMIAALREAVGGALADGFAGLRVASEMAWATAPGHGFDRLEEYERGLAQLLADRPLAVVCQYQRRAFAPSRLAQLEALHTARALAPRVSADGLLRVSRPVAGRFRIAGEVDISNSALLARTLEEAAAAGGEVAIDAERLEFLDLSGLRALAEAARALAPRRRLVLQRPAPHIRRLLELLGDYARQVEVRG
jgi:anti-anti-sigma factor